MQQRQIKQAEQDLSAIWQAQLQVARQQPWLAGLILKRARQFWQRVRDFYRFLSRLPRRRRRRLQRKLAGGLLGAALLLAAGPTPSVQAAMITVTPGAAGIHSGDGCSLVEAIINANNNAQTYTDCAAGSGPDTIVLHGNTYSYTTHYGGASYSGFSALPDIASPITIEGNRATIQRTGGADEFRILKVTASGDLTLNQTTIEDGGFSSPFSIGGGLYLEDGARVTINDSTISGNDNGGVASASRSTTTIEINNSTISDNHGPNLRYGVFAAEGTLTIANSTFSSNESCGVRSSGNLTIDNSTFSYNGCGVSSYGNLTLEDSTVSDNSGSGVTSSGGEINNTVISNNSSSGVGIRRSGTTTINDSTISGNSTTGRGGGVRINSGGTGEINNSTISGNHADDDGGGVSVQRGTATINNSTISGNAAGDGGGLFNYSGTTTINNSTISGNAANGSRFGGGGVLVFHSYGTVTINNSTISGNAANYAKYGGGGIGISYGVNSTLTINDSTISGNAANNNGGGIGISFTLGATLNLHRSLISGNTASDGDEIYSGDNVDNPTINAANYNLFGHSGETEAEAFDGFVPGANDFVATSDNTSPAMRVSTALTGILDPTLADNGGPTLTHALVSGSPALDKIAAGFPATDQRGVARPQGAAADIGAFERVEPQQGIIDLQGDLQTLVNEGVLKPGQANGLTHPLDNAEQSLDDGRPEDACNQLDDFIDEVNDKTPEPLDADTAAGLIVDAEAIQSSIGCQ
jgi:hypothetical protein